MIFQTFGKMNKTSKKNRVDKCPSARTIDNDVDKHNCISKERSHENVDLKNGLMNGQVEGSDTIIPDEDCSRKFKHKSIDITDLKKESDCEKSCTIKNVSSGAGNIDQSHPSEKNNFTRDGIVNSINIISRGQGEVEKSNGNLFCYENDQFYPSNETLQIDQVAESSSKCTHYFDSFMNLKDMQLDVTENCVSEVADCIKNIQLESTLENASEGTETKQDEFCHQNPVIHFIQYESELQMPMIMKIIQKDLSEPYSIYTYRYFIHNWPKLCFLALCEGECVGAIVCKLDVHRKVIKRGYIAMLAVDEKFRKLRIGSNLVQKAINEMIQGDADEVVLETEITNKPALQLYEKLGFVRDKRLFRYYLNGVDALRLKLWLR